MNVSTISDLEDLLKYAMYLYGKNEQRTAGYYAVTAFELILPKNHERENNYFKRIDEYCRINKPITGIKDFLLNCREYRNQIIHYHMFDGVNELISCLCGICGINRQVLEHSLDDEDFRRLRKKFSAGESTCNLRQPLEGLFDGIKEKDFRNLYEMRNTLSYLKEALIKSCCKLDPAVYFDEISDATSAYVWLAAVKNLKGARPKIDQPSLSLLATNNDIRIYIDFGGRCKKERKRYYNLLLNRKLDKHLKALSPEFRMFDIYWYFNLDNVRTMQDFCELRDMGERAFQVDVLKRTVDTFNFHIDSNKTIPENIMLIGRIFSKSDIIKKGKDFKTDVEAAFRELHPIFLEISK